ncbi:MAG: branched-chain amino acid ABC transporter permease [Actinomycetota bacterium]|nr:branched-chain amino acid ABC transporter permease [Actinomycetota bacterium]
MAIIGQQLVNGLTLGGMYALIALGYTLVYGIMLMINFAHSEMFMGGAFVGLFVFTALGKIAFFTGSTIGLVLLFALTFLAAGIVVGTLGVLIERVAYRPLRHAPRLAPLISAIGMSIFLQQAVLLWITARQVPFPNYVPAGGLKFGAVTISNIQIMIIVTSLVLLVVLDTFIAKTRIGKAMRATSQDREAASLMGIDINRVIAVAFFIGPALGAAAGIFSGIYYGSIKFDMGFLPGIKSFTAAVIGGIGNLRGAMLGGFLLGIIESLAAGFLSSGYKDVIAFAILILVLVFRPGGLLGESVVEKV